MSARIQHFTAAIAKFPLWKWWNPAQFANYRPPREWTLVRADQAFIIILVVTGSVLLFTRFDSRVRDRLLSFCWVNASIAALLFALRWWQVPLLGMDIWRFIHEVVTAIWLGRILRYRLKHYPKEQLQDRVHAYRTKYLPKPKH